MKCTRFALFAAAVVMSSLSVVGVAAAERWLQVDPWFYLDLDSIRRDGDGYTYFVMLHSAEQNRDPRASGALSGAAPPPDRVNCATGAIETPAFGGGWTVDDELYNDDPMARYLCPEWFR
ncbi:hypothetical protein ATE48_17350 [Candidatus Viadribacter manganicus]|uniref:Uncharacterized protein n=1 Tax=Candidatus Viadribacter manganicus TaxID=1759059 RepID=A0A1B1ALU0_9PROT|nr:hypothetical protein ATE48_17350 [Candidatus Viadribacter manganicus]